MKHEYMAPVLEEIKIDIPELLAESGTETESELDEFGGIGTPGDSGD